MKREGRNPSYNNPVVPIILGGKTYNMEYHLEAMQWLLDQTADMEFDSVEVRPGEDGKPVAVVAGKSRGIDLLGGTLNLAQVMSRPKAIGLMVQAGFVEIDEEGNSAPTLDLKYIMRHINRFNFEYVRNTVLEALNVFIGPATAEDKAPPEEFEELVTDPTKRLSAAG